MDERKNMLSSRKLRDEMEAKDDPKQQRAYKVV
jgi:hypothetical protein